MMTSEPFNFKRLSLIVREPLFLVRVVVIVIAFLATIVVLILYPKQHRDLLRLRGEYAVVKGIGALEEELNSPEFKAKQDAKVRAATLSALVLNGLSVREGINYAIIDGNVYKEGDAVGDFTLRTVTTKYIILEDTILNQSRTLYFRGEDVL